MTPTHERMLKLLSDGSAHRAEELVSCLSDSEYGSVATVRTHLSSLRKRLRPLGQDVACHIVDGAAYYQHVRLVASSYRG